MPDWSADRKCLTQDVWQRTVRLVESVRGNADETRLLVEPVDLVGESRSRAEVLQVTIRDIGEVQLFGTRADSDVVERVELSSEVVVQKDWHMSDGCFAKEG
jgi:hypothetical protein